MTRPVSRIPASVPRMTAIPPGWPAGVPPAAVTGWEHRAVAWLLDLCPSDYRLYEGWRRHPAALAWLTIRHLDGQVDATRQAYREVRTELAEQVTPQALTEIMRQLETEGLRLVAARRAAGLVYDAMQGKAYVPRL